ncbi:MAG TPA: hypothetical protein VNS22_27595 [Geminicoccus sp.]|uniref:hypothetical protein n=1 Tax=Geminicoccus sp. TaxID=2024832 RepID=UPI002C9D6F3A|nr:hypothetical protein [Geminicoccus sp.]HWL72124.1 hypothetical protein [Geminicoccus sp.]
MPRTLEQIDEAMGSLWLELQAMASAELADDHEDDALVITDAAAELSRAQHLVETVIRNRKLVERWAAESLARIVEERPHAA